MDHSLPIVESCDDCGACCREQESPPGYVMLLASPDMMDAPGPFKADVERLQSLPAAALAELREYMVRLLNGAEQDDPACIWLDSATMQCRYHEHRPSICREFELGTAECIEWRKTYDVDEPASP